MKPTRFFLLLGLLGGAASAQTYTQQLIAATLRAHPEVQSIEVHPGVAPPDARQQRTADRIETTVPLHDMSGDPVGAVTVRAAVSAGDETRMLRAALAVRDEMGRHIVNAANLKDPVPFVPDAPSAPYAQQLVDRTMRAHPELLVVAMHVATLDGADYPIIASSIGRIGKHADEDDLRVIRTGQPATGAYGATKSRYGIELPMYDRDGKLLGALSIGYRFRHGDDETELLRQGRAIEAELRASIPSLASLYGPAR